jgi:hypothetical protein
MRLHPDPYNNWRNSQSTNIQFAQDTIVGDKVYKKVWESNDSASKNWNKIGIIREDSNKTYYRPSGLSVDCLLYDFSLEVGDTVTIRWQSLDEIFDYMQVTSRDSVNIAGAKRLKLELSEIYYFTKETWIEGIGSLQGVLNSCDEKTGKAILLCVKENGQVIYNNASYPDCFYKFNTINNLYESSEKEDYLIFPNPFKDYLNIKVNKPFKNIKVFDLPGRLVYEHKIQYSENEEVLFLDGLKAGIYFLRIWTINSSNIITKIIIKY